MWRYSFILLYLLVITRSISDYTVSRTDDIVSRAQHVDTIKSRARNNNIDIPFITATRKRNLLGPKYPFLFLEIDHEAEGKLLEPDDTKKGSSQFYIQSANSAKIGDFSRLDCNPISWSTCTNIVSDIVVPDEPLVIPCGECYLFDMEGNVTLNGLDIEGKLLFPINHKSTIHTPYVIVQGELEMIVDHDKISPENIGTRFILTGTENVMFDPTKTSNENACAFFGGKCNIGIKPFLVAGGKVNINSMPNSCTTHTPVLKKVYTDPVYDKKNFSQFVTLPESCQFSGTYYISDNFNNSYSNWTGRDGAFMVLSDGEVRVTNRKLKYQGPHIDITPMHPELCLIPNQEYLFVSRLKLDLSNGTLDGENTTCKTDGSMCPELIMKYHDLERERTSSKADLRKHDGPKYGEYFYLTSTLIFEEKELDPKNAYYSLYIYGPERGVDITIDSFELFLPSKSSYPNLNTPCDELVLHGNAEGNGFNPYPMINYGYNGQIKIIEENGNKFWRLFDRSHYRTSIEYVLDTTCFTRGVTYIISSKVRYHLSNGFIGGSKSYYWYIDFLRSSDDKWIERRIVECPSQSAEDGWVSCYGEFIIDEEMAEASHAELKMAIDDYRDGGKFDLDYDDISIRYEKGYVEDLIVDSKDVECWGNGSDVHVTSSMYYSSRDEKSNGFISKIENVIDNNDGTCTLSLNEAATLPIITKEENSDYAVDIALLSRNVIIKGDDEENKKGGYMQILHTKDIVQIIQGVEFVNMGRSGEVDRFALQFLYSYNVNGTIVSKNTFHKSNQRCISIEGTSNLTINHNIGYQCYGHCIYVGDQSKFSLITGNLVSDSKNVDRGNRLSGESDYNCGSFFNQYPNNDYLDNIAVGGEKYGFYFRNNDKTRLEDHSYIKGNLRKIKLGKFSNNIARSFNDIGFYFVYHESDEMIVLNNIKAIKNRSRGLYMYSSRDVTIQNSLFADNGQYGIQMRLVDNLKIIDSLVIGSTDETKELMKPPYFNKLCSSDFIPPIGFSMPTAIQLWDRKDNIGAILTNVRFTNFDHEDECESSIPIGFNPDDDKNNHFDYVTMFNNVTFEGKRIMDALTSNERDVKDIVIHDLDGSSDPLSQASNGMFVSNVNWLKDFSAKSCEKYSNGIAYCANSCYRTVSFMVDQTDSDLFDLRITKQTNEGSDETIIPFSYKLDKDIHRKQYSESFRFFSASLPVGNYKVEFVKDMQSIWPRFVLPRWEAIPDCEGYATAENLNIALPKHSCENLIVNGDMELGVDYWYHRNSYSATKYGGLNAEFGGVKNSTTLRHFNRWSTYSGVGQNLDTSCLRSSMNEFYEIEMYFRLEEGTIPFICNPFSDSNEDRCPDVTFKQSKYVDDKLETEYKGNRASVVIPNNLGEFNLMHGVFKVDETIQSLDRLFMYLEGAHTRFDFLIDNVSVKKLPGVCGEDLIHNGNFDENGKFWTDYGNVYMDIVDTTSSGKALKVSDMEKQDKGVRQYLYIDKDCFKKNQRFEITGKFKIESASDGQVECDRTVWDGELQCSNIRLESFSPFGDQYTTYTEPVAISPDVYQNWSLMSGIMTVTDKQEAHERIYVRLYGTHKDVDVYFDDISIIPIPKNCTNLLMNSGFELGDSMFWLPSDRRRIDLDISSVGASGSDYSLMVQEYTSSSVRQTLDTLCILEGQEFIISAKFKYVNRTDLITGMECLPTVLSLWDDRHCPTVRIIGKDCASKVEYTFWNDIDYFEWDTNDFNQYEKMFTVGPELASCETVYAQIGHYVHSDRALLIDDIQITQRTTSPPTNAPTFAPSKKKNTGPTIQPTIKTDAPTTTNIVGCPSVNDPPLILSTGPVMLEVADTILCTLTRSVTSSESGELSYIPIARSYDNNKWEQAAGEYAASFFDGKGILCYTAGCQINLPDSEEGAEYHLTSSSYSLSERDEYARFLETATFGVTQEQLNTIASFSNSVQDDIVTWVTYEMNSSITPMTSHREYWRKGLNARLPMSTTMGIPNHPCDLYSRWRKMSFVGNDHDEDYLLSVVGEGPIVIFFNGHLRTVVDSFLIEEAEYANYTFNSTYTLCRSPQEFVGGRLYIRLEDENCVSAENPPVNLEGYESSSSYVFDFSGENFQPIDQWLHNGEELVFTLQNSMFDNPAHAGMCQDLPPVLTEKDEPVFGKLSDGSWLMFDPRLDSQTNTPDSPIPDGGKEAVSYSGGESYCANVPRTFLNEDQCQLSSDACRQSSSSKIEILLDNLTIATLNNLTDRYVYGIKGLLVKYEGIVLDHPCTPGLRSRWEPKVDENCNPTDLYSGTESTLLELISGSNDRNPYMRDIYFPEEGKFCNVSDTEPEIEIEVDGECWKRVHDEHMSIFDVTYWVDKHPGGAYNIQKWSENGGTILVYPSLLKRQPHGMANWNNNWKKLTFVGRFGDSLDLSDLPTNLRREEVIDYFDDSGEGDSSKVLVCGSPGEVGNDLSQGFMFDANNGFNTVWWNKGSNRKYVWIMIALQGSDQLRQRVAWALSQILVVVTNAIGDERDNSESFLQYYDIFVRHAFGNYRDILREVSYNPLMAENLSFLGSKSAAYMLERYKVKTSADENFAREIMQLFTMGLIHLNMDGSPKLDEGGKTMLAYSNDDIMSLSRAWTGFDLQPRRGNIEGHNNRLDPMKIVPEWRDRFPKSDTTGGYIGDTFYPLCSDFPSKSFLRKGATYRFLGSSSLPELMSDPVSFATEDTVRRVILNDTSSLKILLCNEDQNGNCVYDNTVTLTENYDCTYNECDIDTSRVVQVADDAYYEFVHQPCVNHIFYNDPVKISPRYGTDKVMCANPKLPVASEACCKIGDTYAERNSLFSGERMTFAFAEERCSAMDPERSICDFYKVNGESYSNSGYFWTADSCLLQVKIKRDGAVAIVHQPSDFLARVPHVSNDNTNYFIAHWERSGTYPIVDNDCDNVCEVLSEGSCLCNTGVIETTAFDEMPSSKAEAINRLNIGAVHPSVFDLGTYSPVTDLVKNITAYLKNNEFNSETIFEYDDDKGRKFFMKNSHSSVYLRGITSGYTGQAFRNAPHFMSFIPSETNLRDAQYETEATLDHYFYHDSTPPFLASRFIQRLVNSNPSPRYIQTVANAFKTGSYAATTGGMLFGSGKYGDLASTFAAIYLDSEARNVLLDADITNGALREPIIKILALMRSMDFVSLSPVTRMKGLRNDIGQMAHEFLSVFSFFLPEFKPYGRVGDAKLVSPEATLLDLPKIIGLINGLTSLVKYGVSSCQGGWGPEYCRENTYTSSPLGMLEFNRTLADTQFSYETFEGSSLKGGLDNIWVGRYYNSHNGQATLDPLGEDNHVVHFSRASWDGEFFSPLVKNMDNYGNPYVVKFKYLGIESSAGGCIGYADATLSSLNTQTWAFCDGNTMPSNGNWVSCQFVVPSEVESFRIVVGDRREPAGNAYFDDIQLASGNETTCTGIDVPKQTPPGQAGYSDAVVEKLSTLLTAGRLKNKAKAIIADAFDKAGSAKDGLHMAQQLILTSAEFHTTNVAKSTDQPRDDVSFPQPTGKPYRAVVYLMLSGGCDSYNLLTPYTCSNGLYESYLDVRQQVALAKNTLLPIPASNQVCSEFGLHPELPDIRDLYNDADLLFFANTGVMSQPVNKDNYYALTNTQLFAHNAMQRETKRIDPYDTSSGTGVLGRMTDVLSSEGHNIGSFSVDRFSVALVGKPGVSSSPIIVDRSGVPEIHLDDIRDVLPKLHNYTQPDSGIFADTWSSSLMESIMINEILSSELEGLTTEIEFPDSYLADTLETVSKLITTRNFRGVDVDTFYIERGGFDTHADVEEALNARFSEINDAFAAFSQEMKAMNMWNNVTLIQTSDFARTLNPNGGDGTDHAWGGNYMMMGGSVKGGAVLGKYPEDMTDEGPFTLGRGRMIPTTPWEAPFRGIASWLGISEDKMNEVLPNLQNFNNSYLIENDKMFVEIEVPPTPSPATQPETLPPDRSSVSPSIASSGSPTTVSSMSPTFVPSTSPTDQPTTNTPSGSPTTPPTGSPTASPTGSPTTSPTGFPTTKAPSGSPTTSLTGSPTIPPTGSPTTSPTEFPTTPPTGSPTISPTGSPTTSPTRSPTTSPTEFPTTSPTGSPTTPTTEFPTTPPTGSPKISPTGTPTTSPTGSPTTSPTGSPTTSPTGSPTTSPTGSPTTSPTGSPTTSPTGSPTTSPTGSPTTSPTGSPTTSPTGSPTTSPTGSPTTSPTRSPTTSPTRSPTISPTESPTTPPSGYECEEKISASFYVKNKSLKTCKWLSKSKKRAAKFCLKWLNWGEHNGSVYGPPGFVCRVTCSNCDPCYQNKKTKFYYKTTPKGKVLLKNCAWLDSHSKLDEICSDGKTDEVYPPAHEACPTSCSVGSC